MATIEEVYNLAPGQMIFDMLDQYNPKWVGLYSNEQLNLLYLNHAGTRNVSPLIYRLLKGDTVLSSEARSNIGSLINIMYMKNWSYEWDALFGEYSPIENYNMIEDENTTNTNTTEATNANELTSTNTNTRNTTSSSNGSSNSETDNKVYGYDSNVATNDSSNTVSDTSNNTTTDTGTITDNRSDNSSTTSNSTNNGNEKRNLNRHGNIGVKSSQQLINEEIELRKFKFFDLVFRDIDELLCSRIISV